MQGARKRLEREDTERRSLAWQIAALQRQEKLPSLKSYLGEAGGPVAPQTPDQLEAMGLMLAQVWGAEDQT